MLKEIFDRFESIEASGVMEDITLDQINQITEMGYSCTIANGKCLFSASGENIFEVIKGVLMLDTVFTDNALNLTMDIKAKLTLADLVLIAVYNTRNTPKRSFSAIKDYILEYLGV